MRVERCVTASFLALSLAVHPNALATIAMPAKPSQSMSIRILFNGKVITAKLHDTPAGRDFYAMLPLKLDWRDHAATEKVADLPRKLSVKDAPSGYQPSRGDIAYYGPWGNLAIYYKDFAYSEGLVKLATIDGGIEHLAAAKPGPVMIERDIASVPR